MIFVGSMPIRAARAPVIGVQIGATDGIKREQPCFKPIE
jgi:hypothetical protein